MRQDAHPATGPRGPGHSHRPAPDRLLQLRERDPASHQRRRDPVRPVGGLPSRMSATGVGYSSPGVISRAIPSRPGGVPRHHRRTMVGAEPRRRGTPAGGRARRRWCCDGHVIDDQLEARPSPCGQRRSRPPPWGGPRPVVVGHGRRRKPSTRCREVPSTAGGRGLDDRTVPRTGTASADGIPAVAEQRSPAHGGTLRRADGDGRPARLDRRGSEMLRPWNGQNIPGVNRAAGAGGSSMTPIASSARGPGRPGSTWQPRNSAGYSPPPPRRSATRPRWAHVSSAAYLADDYRVVQRREQDGGPRSPVGHRGQRREPGHRLGTSGRSRDDRAPTAVGHGDSTNRRPTTAPAATLVVSEPHPEADQPWLTRCPSLSTATPRRTEKSRSGAGDDSWKTQARTSATRSCARLPRRRRPRTACPLPRAAGRQLWSNRCADCGTWHSPPRSRSTRPACRSRRSAPVSGAGHDLSGECSCVRALLQRASFLDACPVVTVDLDEQAGLRFSQHGRRIATRSSRSAGGSELDLSRAAVRHAPVFPPRRAGEPGGAPHDLRAQPREGRCNRRRRHDRFPAARY